MIDVREHPSIGEVLSTIDAALKATDDRAFWRAALDVVFCDAEFLCKQSRSELNIGAQVGSCSHWLRPHQYRWCADGSFAAPYGYAGSGFAIRAWPEFDWSARFHWHAAEARWQRIDAARGKRPLWLRITLPTRTTIHHQAAVHTVWTPGSPTDPQHKSQRLYGFRKHAEEWICTATAGDEQPYALAGVN